MTLRLVDIGGDTLINPEEVAAVYLEYGGRVTIRLRAHTGEVSASTELSLGEVVERLTAPEPFITHGSI